MAEAAQTNDPTAHRDSEESLTSGGQRHINVMWEGTQRLIALGVMATFLLVCLLIVVGQILGHETVEMPPSLAGVVGYVIGSYFARTNHEKTGGVGQKGGTARPYEGR